MQEDEQLQLAMALSVSEAEAAAPPRRIQVRCSFLFYVSVAQMLKRHMTSGAVAE